MSAEYPEIIRTVGQAVRVKVPIGLCRFFSSVMEVASEDQAKAFIETVSKEFADATHNAWAYRIGVGAKEFTRYSDDGEPTNTAGPPTLQAIIGADVTNVVIVGTRYFGGVKLGVGGLIRAYRECAQAGLQEAGVREDIVMVEIVVKNLDYAILGDVLREIEGVRGQVIDISYGHRVLITASIRPKDQGHLQKRIIDITRGQGQLEVV